MREKARLLAVIPARAESKGLPGKNLRSFAGLPLMAHSILFAKLCPGITRVVVSTEDEEIAQAALSYGAQVPFRRPKKLAQDEIPLWDVLRHSLQEVEVQEGVLYDFVLLLDPTSPAREPSDLKEALNRLEKNPRADGVIGVSRPEFNPMWHCVVEENGWMRDLIAEGARFEHRQEVPAVYRINGSLYLWRASFVRKVHHSWRGNGKHLLLEIPELRAMSIDDLSQFEQAECLVKNELITLPWLARGEKASCGR